jgi:Tfp pilus assembly protein FimT
MGKDKKAFTFIELLIIISIVILFTSIMLPRFNTYNQQLKLKSDANKVIAIFELAKKKAIVSDLYDQSCLEFNGYRITLSNDSYILKFTCAGAYQNIQTYNFESDDSVVVGSGDFDFPALGINTNLTIDLIRLKNSVINQCLDIDISAIGIISLNEALIGC